MTFNEKLVKLRKLKGITQDELASAVGVSRQAVYKWESGQSYPEVPKLIEIKLLFGISIDDLLDESYEVHLPEKKTRKKRSASTVKAEKKEEVKEPVPAVTEEQSAPVSEIKKEDSAPAAEIKEENTAKDIPAEDNNQPEEIKEEKAEEKKEEKKRGFFARLFGR